MGIRPFLGCLRRILSIGGGHRRVCIVDALYPLFLYLLYSTEEEVRQTLFVFGKTIPVRVAAKLGHCMYATDYEPQDPKEREMKKKRFHSRLKLWLVNLLYISRRRVFAQDHLTFSAKVLCRTPYTLIEDAPGSYAACLERLHPLTDPKEQREDYFYEGNIHGRYMGSNPYCVNRLVSRQEDLSQPLAKGRRHEFVDLKGLWEGLLPERRAWILDVFEVDDDLIADLQSHDTVVFTQPLMLDCGIDAGEMRQIFGPCMERYGEANVLIKVHPRDEFDYSQVFPQARLLKTIAPMQLITLVARPFKRAITICSTAVFHLPAETEVVWLGTRVNEKILKRYGDY